MPLGHWPDNISRRALRDLIGILRHSRKHFTRATTARTEARLVARCIDVDKGRAGGHRRPDIDAGGATLFINERPWVIAYDVETRQVLRILHGARDLPALIR